MAKIERTVTINAPVEKVFAYLEDPMTNLEWLPAMMDIEIVASTEEKVAARWRWVYRMAGLRFEGESTMAQHIPNERIVTESKGGIISTWTWIFQPHDGGTQVDLVVEYTVPIPVLGRLAESLVQKQNEREADLAIANIKARMEG